MSQIVCMEMHGWLFLGSILFCLGGLCGISLFMALCRREPIDVENARLKMERADLKQLIRTLKEANDDLKGNNEDLSASLEWECNHTHLLQTNQEYYRKHTRLDRRVEIHAIEHHLVDLRA